MSDMKEIRTSSNKMIRVYDDYISFFHIEKFYNFIRQSKFMISGADGVLSTYKNQVYSTYSTQDLISLGMLDTDIFKKLREEFSLDRKEIKQIRVNCSTFSEDNTIHCDNHGLTFLYCVNPVWDISWSGHTVFLSDDLKESEYLSLYKPGRIVLFDGTIPHLILTPTHKAVDKRLSFVIQYKER